MTTLLTEHEAWQAIEDMVAGGHISQKTFGHWEACTRPSGLCVVLRCMLMDGVILEDVFQSMSAKVKKKLRGRDAISPFFHWRVTDARRKFVRAMIEATGRKR